MDIDNDNMSLTGTYEFETNGNTNNANECLQDLFNGEDETTTSIPVINNNNQSLIKQYIEMLFCCIYMLDVSVLN